MELQIQDLVDSIKRDGIAEAEKKAAQIVSEAKQKADELVRNGAKEAAKLVEDAKKDVSVMQQSGKAAIEQAGRDVILSLKKSINSHFDRLLEKTVSNAMTSDDLVKLIVQVVRSGMTKAGESAVELSATDFAKLADSLRSELAAELKAGLEIRPVPSVSVGFRLSSKDGSSYYDFSAEETARMLAPFLNTTIQEMLLSAPDAR
jgi:V/A-type H+-transporting ATPase subunit E